MFWLRDASALSQWPLAVRLQFLFFASDLCQDSSCALLRSLSIWVRSWKVVTFFRLIYAQNFPANFLSQPSTFQDLSFLTTLFLIRQFVTQTRLFALAGHSWAIKGQVRAFEKKGRSFLPDLSNWLYLSSTLNLRFDFFQSALSTRSWESDSTIRIAHACSRHVLIRSPRFIYPVTELAMIGSATSTFHSIL